MAYSNTVYPLYTLIITVALAGFPSAVAKFVAEDAALGGRSRSLRVIRIASGALIVSGLLFGAAVYFGAPLIGWMIGNASVVPALSGLVLRVAVRSADDGAARFFQGYQNMMPTAVSQIAEQGVRVAVMIILLVYLTSAGASAETIAAGALLVRRPAGLPVLLSWADTGGGMRAEGKFRQGPGTGMKPARSSPGNPEAVYCGTC
ncbi:oligosaccharide flippase family protein [Paenibacillus sp. JTLBN-2024]